MGTVALDKGMLSQLDREKTLRYKTLGYHGARMSPNRFDKALQ